MRRTVYDDDQTAFRELVRAVVQREVAPDFAAWEEAGVVPRSLYRRLGELGILGIAIPEEFDGGGQSSYKFSAVLTEETMSAQVNLGALRVHMDIVLPYLLRYFNDMQKSRWLPKIASGEIVTAIAMTEPGTGSDVAGITTSAVRDGDSFVVNGAKTFITGGVNADLVMALVRTSPAVEGNRRAGLSLLLIEATSPGYSIGRNMKKLGLKAQDTVELTFDDVRVPAENLLGEEGGAFEYLSHNLPQERLSIAVGSLAAAQTAVRATVDYVRERKAFGQPIWSFQNTRFTLAECAAELEAAQSMVDHALDEHDAGELSAVDAAKVKLFCTELQGRVIDKCLQLYGGYGYMLEYPIARLYADARVTRIYGGTSEIMKSIISKSMI